MLGLVPAYYDCLFIESAAGGRRVRVAGVSASITGAVSHVFRWECELGMDKTTGRPTREYSILSFCVFVAVFCIVWIVGVLNDQQYNFGEVHPTVITASGSPTLFWASIVFFAALFIAMIVVCLRGEMAYRGLLVEFESIKGCILKARQSGTVKISIGSDDGVEVTNTFHVYDGAKLVGTLEITKVAPDHATAKITDVQNGVRIKRGDQIKIAPD
jgi:hypothetical protein